MENYINYNLDENTVSLFKECFDKNGSPKNSENIKWQFLNNMESNSYVAILFDGNKQKTAGIYALSCVKFKVENKIIVGTQSLDTLTDIEYRGLGLFIKLARDVYEKAQNENVGLVYGFPNGSSFPGFKKLLKWQVLDPLPFLIKPLRSKYFTNKVNILRFLPNFNLSFSKFRNDKNFIIKEENQFPVQVDVVWKKFSEAIRVSVVRDQKYLNWRYIQKPNEAYKIVHCYFSDNIYLGYVVYTVKNKHKGKIAYIMELIYDIEKPRAGDLLLEYAIQDIKKQNADCILSWCLDHSPNYSVFKNKVFLKMPEKIRPIELHFGVRCFKQELSSIVNDRQNWYISYSDSDTV